MLDVCLKLTFLRERFIQTGLASSWQPVQEAGAGESVSHHTKRFW